MDYTTLAAQASLNATKKGLVSKGYQAIVVKTGEEALKKVKALIPKGASVMNGASTTLQQIGYIEYLKSGEHGWNNLHAAIAGEKDPVKQAALRKQAVSSEYYLGSVHALAETGEFVIASNTGSQLPHVVFTSPNLIYVVSTKKIVPTLETALSRLKEHVIPLENDRMMKAYNMPTTLNKIVIVEGESPFNKRTITFILIEEDLGF